MEPKILRLPETVINQIAAGEVVENPASIVKELVENSLDAGALHIHVSLTKGGFERLEVEDDGCGMGPHDALLSLERHATSKIRAIEDLNTLATMGFRGEAIASIASVSQFSLTTSNGSVATHLVALGGRLLKNRPCARNRGTSIVVSDLFFNTPARKKFQKSIASSVAQVRKSVETISLAHPEVAFSLKVDGLSVFEVEAQPLATRIEAVFGPFDHEVKGDIITGFFKGPHAAKPTRREQTVFVNMRPVVSPLLAKAVKTGYGTRLAETMYPSFVLFVNVDPQVVDVNVHPQKKEVRFADESKMFCKVEESVSRAFGEAVASAVSLSFHDSAPFRMQCESFLPPPEPIPTLPFERVELGLFTMGPYLFLDEGGLIVADLRSAHARVLFESLQTPSKEAQALLFPLDVAIDDESFLHEMQSLGIECRLTSSKRMAIDALPPSLDAAQFPLFLSSWKEEARRLERASQRFCRNLQKRYTLDEGIDLWRRLKKCRDALYDPLGNKIWKRIEQKDVESWLSRA